MRLAPLPDEEWDARSRSALAVLLPENRLNVRGAGNALATLVRHPDLTEALMTFNKHLMLHSTVPPRLRELAILRVAQRRGCAYEWSHHTRMAAKLGLSPDEIEAAGQGKAPIGLATTELDSAVLTAADELDIDSRVSDATWARLGAHLDERQRMDLVFTIGAYAMLAMAFNTFGVEPEHER